MTKTSDLMSESRPPDDTPPQITMLECPCCGDDGAVSDHEGYFTDGQPLICGCPGWVSCDSETGPEINNGDEACELHQD